MNFYIHTPIGRLHEAFGQTYVEALAAGVPSIFSLSGIALEFVQHEANAIVVPYEDAESIANALERLHADSELCQKLTVRGRVSVQRFQIQPFLESLQELYES